MTQGERVREIRKNFNLTLEKFGEKLGVGKSSISDIENNRRSLTEHMTKSICREFNVDYIWLTTGEGEMFVETDDDIIEIIDRIMSGENELHKKLIKWCATSLDEEDLQRLQKKIDEFVTEFSKKQVIYVNETLNQRIHDMSEHQQNVLEKFLIEFSEIPALTSRENKVLSLFRMLDKNTQNYIFGYMFGVLQKSGKINMDDLLNYIEKD